MYVTFEPEGGRRLSYQLRGSGPLVVCIPGGPGMDPEAYFAGLELPGRQLLVFAPRGTGESSVPPAPGGYVMAGYADDVEALREHLGQHKLTLYLDRLCAAPVNWAAATSSWPAPATSRGGGTRRVPGGGHRVPGRQRCLWLVH
jgi:hypothetical protein